MKILSPVGNFDSLKMAIFNGADEVYLGINEFNARNNIEGFNLEDLEQVVDYAHIFDVKVLLAVNILFSDNEIQKALDVIVKAFNYGVDAFILQDLGLAKLVQENFPEIELHASTQMAIHNLEGVQFIEQFGFKRVVLARETPLEEIKRIRKNSNIEIEYFVQGALCVSFSGNCYLSSYLLNASGNRGRCKQLCRLPYTLQFKGKALKNGYLLSAKDFNMVSKLKDLKNAGVDVLKIEGRARRPFYVAIATRQYKNALSQQKVDNKQLELAFNRDYTPGYFNGNSNIISNIQSHKGINVGKIVKINSGKRFNEVYFSSNRKLNEKSSFKVFNNEKEVAVITAYDLKESSNDSYVLTTTQKVNVGDQINLIVDNDFENEVLSQNKKKNIEINVVLGVNVPIKAFFCINKQKYEVEGEILLEAKNNPLTEEEIIQNFSKNQIFSAEINFIKTDYVFLAKKQLNEFRRKVYDRLFEVLTKPYKKNIKQIKISNSYRSSKFEDFEIVENKDFKSTKQNIVYSPSEYILEDIIDFQNICNKSNKKAYLDLPNFALEKDIKNLKEIIQKTNISIISNNYYSIEFKTENIIGAGLNVYNNITASVFKKPIISAESQIGSKIDFAYMTLRHCPFKEHLKASCDRCPYKEGYEYKMDNGKVLKIKRKKLSTCTFYLTD